ncbi:AzlC family ABC transporter permease [Actinomyces massiliensis]|jgi:azlC family protein|uniref:AzlC family ABC transporter permease n=1 Tax=Actinomyces massiliensis TaxID=461393 RepID=UPI0028E2098B|nr:AzlC family ABC transporter permease [Actinomyces massiliensis]
MSEDGFRAGLIDAIPIILGYMPVCLTFGAVGAGLELDPVLVFGFSALLYAGASQFVAIQLLAAHANGILIVATIMLVNLRYALLARSFRNRVEARGIAAKAAIAPLLTEEVYAVAMYGEREKGTSLSTRYILGLQIPPYFATMIFTAIGIGFGSIIPTSLLPAFSSSLYALLIGLVLPRILTDRTTAVTCAVSATVSAAISPIWGSALAVIAAAIASFTFYEALKRIGALAQSNAKHELERQ